MEISTLILESRKKLNPFASGQAANKCQIYYISGAVRTVTGCRPKTVLVDNSPFSYLQQI